MHKLFSALACCAAITMGCSAIAQPRVISTDAAVTDILFRLGADSALVGVDVTSQLPTGYRELPRVGYHRALSPEGLLALAPELLLGSEHLGPPQVVSTLRNAGVTVLQLPSPTDADTLAGNVQRIARQMALGDTAQPLLEQLQRDVERIEGQPLDNDTAVFLLSVEAGKLRLAGSDTAGGAFIDLLGARNLGEHRGYRTLSAEALMALQPSLILVADHEGSGVEALLQHNPILQHGIAARQDRIRQVRAADLVAGISLGAVSQARALCAELSRSVVRR